MQRDWLLDAAMLRRYLHVADPWDLTLAEFNGLLDRLDEILEAESGKEDHAARVDRMRRRRHEDDGW